MPCGTSASTPSRCEGATGARSGPCALKPSTWMSPREAPEVARPARGPPTRPTWSPAALDGCSDLALRLLAVEVVTPTGDQTGVVDLDDRRPVHLDLGSGARWGRAVAGRRGVGRP